VLTASSFEALTKELTSLAKRSVTDISDAAVSSLRFCMMKDYSLRYPIEKVHKICEEWSKFEKGKGM
jgi:hypothetical protein